MLAGLYSAATGLNAATRNHELIAENLANMVRPGHRRAEVSFQSFDQTLSGATNPVGLGTQVVSVQTDFSTGPIAHTGRNLDVALEGEGFFVLQGPRGQLFTRSGVFFLDAQRRLVSAEGLPVLGEAGPIQLPDSGSSETIHVAADGSISVQGAPVGRLRIVDFVDKQRLIPVGPANFAAPAELAPRPADTAVRQGARELSNASPVTELVRMIAGMRHYEAAERVLRAIAESVQQQTSPTQG